MAIDRERERRGGETEKSFEVYRYKREGAERDDSGRVEEGDPGKEG